MTLRNPIGRARGLGSAKEGVGSEELASIFD